ncbi:MAG: HEPN domain-containing protein [Deltaproteobacteria bacterium]|nr:HEPN domain-containing protein [Deltaproteobacteria bacterium]
MKRLNPWFELSREDWRTAEWTLQEKIFNQTCFHSQQGVEKILKGVLFEKGRDIPKTHHLSELLTLCEKHFPALGNFREECLLLDRYYIPTRYPDALPGSLPEGLPSMEDAKKALDTFQHLRMVVIPPSL